MSIDGGEGEETKYPDGTDAMVPVTAAVNGSGRRVILGYEILDTLGKGMSGK